MKRTKELLTDTFWELLEEKAYSKITVNDIVSRCDVNRNTFYYHFQDIPSLMINSIEKWADGIIKEYAISEKSVNCLSYMAQECTKRKKAMLHLFRSVEKEKLLSNMNEIAYHIICTYANEMKEKRNISEQDKETLIQCYKCFFVGSLLLDISLSGDPHHRLQRLDHLVILHLMRSRNDRAELYASGGLHDHVVASLYLQLQRIEEIYLARCTKSHTDYFCHIYLPH